MRIPIRLTIVLTAGAVFAACYQDRGVLFVDDAGPNGSGGDDGAVPSTGGAGNTAASGGAGGSPVGIGCDIAPIITSHTCTIANACHDSMGSAAGLDLQSPGLEARLLGIEPTGGGQGALASKCVGQGRLYLIPGSRPAAGLLLQKLGPNPPPCGGRMPLVGAWLSATELACFQAWANALTAGTGGP
jgi:hypothetical protein